MEYSRIVNAMVETSPPEKTGRAARKAVRTARRAARNSRTASEQCESDRDLEDRKERKAVRASLRARNAAYLEERRSMHLPQKRRRISPGLALMSRIRQACLDFLTNVVPWASRCDGKTGSVGICKCNYESESYRSK